MGFLKSTSPDENNAASDLELIHEEYDLTIEGVQLQIPVVRREGNGKLEPIVFLHGFGSTKEDYVDMIYQSALSGRPFLAYDAPGCGESLCDDLSKISIPFLKATAQAVLQRAGIQRFHICGHSMGGLTALMLAYEEPTRVISFIDIEGNVAPEDCFLSRQVITYHSDDPAVFFEAFVQRTRSSREFSSALYAASLRHKVRIGAVRGIFESMVHLSDNADLMTKFLGLPCPRMFMYGEQNSHLSYLGFLESKGVELANIPQSGHWPMYANPIEMWRRISHFLNSQEE